MNVLIVYGTTEGQTRKIAEGTALRVRERGHGTELLDSAALVLDFNIDKYDAFIIAASVHQEYHQETITNFVMAHLVHFRKSIGCVGGNRSAKVPR